MDIECYKSLNSKYEFPFTEKGVIKDNCQGLVFNCGLITQCPISMSTIKKSGLENSIYCKRCMKSCIDGSGIPALGNVELRLKNLYNYKSIDGKKSQISYGNYLKKKKIDDINDVLREASNNGIEIDENHLIVVKRTRTPKKKDDDDKTKSTLTKVTSGKRGRPPKQKIITNDNNKSENDDDVSNISELTNDFKEEVEAEEEEEEAEEEEEDEEEETQLYSCVLKYKKIVDDNKIKDVKRNAEVELPTGRIIVNDKYIGNIIESCLDELSNTIKNQTTPTVMYENKSFNFNK